MTQDLFRVTIDESPVEICEANKRLYILDMPRDRPILDGLDLVCVHIDPFWCNISLVPGLE